MGLLATGAAAGLAVAAYGFVEPHLYRLQTHVLDVAGGRRPVSVLHLSDTHIARRDRRLAGFLRELPDRLPATPDLVVATGDLIEGDAGIDAAVVALTAVPARLGRFYVLGSHDYFKPRFENYLKYFTGRRRLIEPHPADTRRLEDGLRAAGWIPVTNRCEVVERDDGPIRICGVDDPYLRRHRTGHIHGDAGDVYRIGLVHAPDVVSEFFLHGFDLVVAGHTHGGQVRLPPLGAVVTNSRLPARLAGGPHRVGEGWLHVSPGLGTGKFAPVRLFCRPEATLLRLVARVPGA